MKTDEKALRAAAAHGYIVCDDLPLATRSFIKGYKVACQEAAGEGKVTVDREALFEVLRISDRAHPAWDTCKQAILKN